MTIYLDYNSTTPILPSVLDLMLETYKKNYGNPSSTHQIGQQAQQTLQQSRQQIAQAINAHPDEIIFCSNGTEANNLAIQGICQQTPNKKHIITTAIEHSSIVNTCQYLAQHHNYQITYLPVDKQGTINPQHLTNAITPNTALITIMLANNEIGTIQPIQKLAKIAQHHNIPIHTDAVQALGKLPIDTKKLNTDMLTISAHKIYGPKGIAALYLHRRCHITPQIHGGSQEQHKRAGTENLPAIVGFAKAIELATTNLNQNIQHLTTLRDQLETGITSQIPFAKINAKSKHRIANTTNISFKGLNKETILINLDQNNICASAGSACNSTNLDPTRVLKALQIPQDEQFSAIRFSVGINTSKQEIEQAIKIITKTIYQQKKLITTYCTTKCSC